MSHYMGEGWFHFAATSTLKKLRLNLINSKLANVQSITLILALIVMVFFLGQCLSVHLQFKFYSSEDNDIWPWHLLLLPRDLSCITSKTDSIPSSKTAARDDVKRCSDQTFH